MRIFRYLSVCIYLAALWHVAPRGTAARRGSPRAGAGEGCARVLPVAVLLYAQPAAALRLTVPGDRARASHS
jgi:hypothetical protein